MLNFSISIDWTAMAKGKGGAKPTPEVKSSGRQNGKAWKKHPKVWDPVKRRLVVGEPTKG